MAKTKYSFDDLIAIGNRAELRSTLASTRIPLTLTEAQKLNSRLDALEPPIHSLRLAIAHSYTSQLLDPWLSLAGAVQGLELKTYHAPYGMMLQEAREDSDLVRHEPELTLFLLQREDLHPDLAKPLVRFDSSQQAELSSQVLRRLGTMITQFRQHNVGQIVVTLLPAVHAPGLGLFDAQFERSESAWWAKLKVDIARVLRESVRASLFLDLDDVLQQIGRVNFFDPRLWYLARFPFTPLAAREVARRVVSLGAVVKLPKAKVIVLDADNTLWGGIVGEDGMDGIALGPDYPGNTFVDFQRRLLDFQQRGFLLALCSKNNPGDVEQVLRDHPHQLLREAHFAARRVNWLPKPDNLIALAAELNLGLDSFVFVDDSEHECAAVRQRLPQVEVIQTPGRPVDIPTCLEQVARLEVLSLTAEDLAKTEMYAQDRRRRELKEHAGSGEGSMDEYLASLEMKMQVTYNETTHLARLSQLTQKTNQFNLTTRRYNEHQMLEFIVNDDCLVADFALADVFGHSGVAGLAIVRSTDKQRAELDTFLMSCRVIGRDAEAAFLHSLLRHLAEQGVTEVYANFLPTEKNELAKNFLPEQGFEKHSDNRYRWHLSDTPPKPESAFRIKIVAQI